MFLSNLTLQTPSTKSIISIAASTAATAMLIRSMTREYVPSELSSYLSLKLRRLIASFSSEMTLVIEEYDGFVLNHLFKAAELYLEPSIPPSTRRIKVSMPNKDSKISVSVQKNEEIIDNFHGVKIKWRLVSAQVPPRTVLGPENHYYGQHMQYSENKYFVLSFHKKHREFVLGDYLEHVLSKSKEVAERKKTPRLFTLVHERVRIMGRRADVWQGVYLHHPATFDTLAMDTDIKRMVMEDLERFVKRKEYYRKVGKAWKRGYLLFGPPGTGKSSLIAAMANYLNFDVFDLELTEVRGNSELRQLIISTANKSILVVEDIDCSIQLKDRLAPAGDVPARAGNPFAINKRTEVTLSGLLNFIDGLWSSCGDERIIVFTTNHKEKLDPALLRPGRMDVHIHMSYCTPCGFRLLASNYLGVSEHWLFPEVEELLGTTKVTPAEVAEELMKNEIPEVALKGLVDFLERKKREVEDAAAAAAEAEAAEIEAEAVTNVKLHETKDGNVSESITTASEIL